MRYPESKGLQTYMEWVMMGYRVCEDAVAVDYDENGEPLFHADDVYLDDVDM